MSPLPVEKRHIVHRAIGKQSLRLAHGHRARSGKGTSMARPRTVAAAGKIAGEKSMSSEDDLILLFDDDGNELRPGDKVRVNDEEIRTIVEDKCGRNILEHRPEDEIVYNLELVWPP